MAQYQQDYQAYYGQSNNPPPISNPPSQSMPYQSQYSTYLPQASLSPPPSHHPPPPPPPPSQEPHQFQYQQHQYQHPHQNPLRRVPSFIAGDDAEYFEDRLGNNQLIQEANAGRGSGYTSYSNNSSSVQSVQSSLGSRHSQFSTSSSQQSAPSRASSHGSSALSSAVSFRHPYQPSSIPSTSPNQPGYNPQTFSRPHSHSQPAPPNYTSQTYTGVGTTQQSSPGPAYQPYIPAAYGSYNTASLQWPSAAASQRQSQSPGSHSGFPSSQMQPPPPPLRGADPYGARQSPRYSDASPETHYGYSPTQPPSSPPVPPKSAAHSQTTPSPIGAPYPSGSPYSGSSTGSFPSRSYSHASPQASYFMGTQPLVESNTLSAHEQPPVPPMHQPQSDYFQGKWSEDHQPSLRTSGSSPALQPPRQTSPRRTDTLARHPQSRPLPGPPSDWEEGPRVGSGTPDGSGNLSQRQHGEWASVDPGQVPGPRRHSSRTSRVEPADQCETPPDPFASSSSLSIAGADTGTMHLSPDERHTPTNGSIATGTGQYVNYSAYSDESDAEAAAGLAMMRVADEEDRANAELRPRRERSETSASLFSIQESHTPNLTASPFQATGSDSDYAHHDLALYGGGYAGDMHYGKDTSLNSDLGRDDETVINNRIEATSGSFSSSNQPIEGKATRLDEYDYPPFADDFIHPFPPFSTAARVDTGGTGGLTEPGSLSRRLSFDDEDEGEGVLSRTESVDRSASQSPARDELGELFFHPGMRPLPPAPVEPAKNANLAPHLIPAGTYRTAEQGSLRSHDQYNVGPRSPDAYEPQSQLNLPQVPRSTSLCSPSGTPRPDRPTRAKTDADRVKYKQQQEMLHRQSSAMEYTTPVDVNPMALDLPAIPAARRKKLNPAKISSEQFRRCYEPWALSMIVAWVKDLSEDETDLKEQAIVDAIVALFTHKVPTMNIADAETLGARVVKNMLAEGALLKEEEWVKFGPGILTGVLFQITGKGCYSSKLHVQETEMAGRCYSHHCMRTLKKVNLQADMVEPQRKVQDWMTFYNVPKEVWESYPKKEIDRQNILHEIVTTEDAYIGQLDVLRELYRDQLATQQPPIINPKHLKKFLPDVFGKVDAVKKVNEEYLLAQLKYRQKEQGPFIVGFSDIFREWIRKARATYTDYAATFPKANYMVRREAERNVEFKKFLNRVREDGASNRLGWDTFLKAPITRIQRYTLLLSTVHKSMAKDSEEKTNLAQAIEEIKQVASDCDAKVGEMSKKVDLMELAAKLQLRPEMKVELNLEHLGRQIIFQGNLQRPGNRTRFNLMDTYVILFDHYLVLAKTVTNKDSTKTLKFYDVSKVPIPIYLLFVESTNDDPVVKSSVKGISTVAPPPPPTRTSVSGGLTHSNTNASLGAASVSSGKSFVPSTVILENPKDDRILYPFRIKHLGKAGTYTLYAHTLQSRQDWCDKIIEAKTKHAASLFAQNAEPFRLRVLADTAFGYSENAGSSTVIIKGTPLDRAIRHVEEQYPNLTTRPNPVCRAAVNCATIFQQPPGRLMCAIGTDYGVYISAYNDPRGWVRAIQAVRVTQIAVFEDFNLLLLIADKSLIAYHLDVVCPASGVPSQTSQHDSARRAPQKLSGSREVGFFAVGRMKDRTLVFYKKRDGLSSTFKVLEPVLQKSATSRSRFFSTKRGQTEFFRDYDDFYIPTESYGINLFHSSVAISTQRGIEVLTLEKKTAWSVPNLRSEAPEAQEHLTGIANRIKDLRPLGMFRVSEAEFLVAYSECAIYVNSYGDVSRSVIHNFVGHANTACLYGKFLILLNDDFVEVRNAMNGRLRQVIAGRNVVCLDDGGNASSFPSSGLNAASFSPTHDGKVNGELSTNDNGDSGRTVKICMQHPEYVRSQIIVELIENEDQKD